MQNQKPLLQVERLTVSSARSSQSHAIVDDVSFTLQTGTALALVGKSGSGKTTLSRALTKLFLPTDNLKISGSVSFDNIDLLSCDAETLQRLRRHAIRYVFQNPQQALNPVARVRTQLQGSRVTKRYDEAVLTEAVTAVGLPLNSLDLFPFQLSIGMAQRVAIAMAVLPKPALLIADEPTSALDPSHRYQILDILKSLQRQNAMSMIIITHDLDIARRYADHIAIMLEGKLVEHKSCAEFFEAPQHDYSKQLLHALLESQSSLSEVRTT
jgi:microcin C transport system ATP-binding protein